MDDLEFVANLYYVLLCSLLYYHQINHLLYRFIILLHLITSFSLTRSLLVTYVYVCIESIDCILLPPFEFKAIFLISSVKASQLAHTVTRMSPYGPVLFETSRTIIGLNRTFYVFNLFLLCNV